MTAPAAAGRDGLAGRIGVAGRFVARAAALSMLVAFGIGGAAGPAGAETGATGAGPVADALQQAQALVEAGAHADARGAATRAHGLARDAGDPAALARATLLLAELARIEGDLPIAGQRLDAADALVRALDPPAGQAGLSAVLALARAHLQLARADTGAARSAYREAFALGQQADDDRVVNRALVGELALSSPAPDRPGHDALRDAAIGRIDWLPAGGQHDRLVLELAGALVTDRGSRPAAGDAALMAWLDERLDAVATSAAASRQRSLAHGLQARLHEARGRPLDALARARQASFHAQDLPALQYQWLWMSARLLDEADDADGAIAGYRLAAQTLDALADRSVEPRRAADAVSVRTRLADLLLRKASALAGRPEARELLREARLGIESLKAAELRDYFQDDCVTALKTRITPIDEVPAGTAVIYPIQLADRLELLVSLPGEIRQVTVDVERDQLLAVVRRLRAAFEKRTTREFLPPARQMYRWIVAPIDAMLAAQQIDTLVFVPDSALRLIPLGALHDGERFLVERFAVAVTPGLALTDARPLAATRIDALLAGVSKPVHGLAALRRVPDELAAIRTAVGGLLMENEQFGLQRFSRALEQQPFTVVHIASHAEFDPDPARSFVAAFDGKIGLERLGELVGVGQYRSRPIELMVLSACQTAAGDERAALGLAGIAVKSGARSVVAGLWAVDDAAAATLMTDFYAELGRPPISRARALQRAQIRMIADRRYAHPGFWAPFLLIGSWL